MKLDRDTGYRALTARDERFDGVFFAGVTTTGIYCRPVCPARTPRRERCVFFATAAAAEAAGFRACFRCRPELAPGSSAVDATSRLVRAALAHIEGGALNEGSLEDLARALGVSDRHLRRSMRSELGASPVEVAQSRRLALALQLVRGGDLSMIEIALASGFRSVRRFNSLFSARYGHPPSRLRERLGGRPPRPSPGAAPHGTIALRLDYRPPYDWGAMLRFLSARAVLGVESVEGGAYLRTVRVGVHRGWISIAPAAGRHALEAKVSLSLAGALLPLVALVRRCLDLDAHPAAISAHLARDPELAPSVARRPGLRLPGAFDPVEAGARAVLGQRVSVAAATTLAARLTRDFGEAIATPYAGLTRLFPSARSIELAPLGELAAIGIAPARGGTLKALASALASAEKAPPGHDPERAIDALVRVPGIGPWTANYVAMRALSWPDAFVEGDLVIHRALGTKTAREARARAERWRPFRAYAVLHLWAGHAEGARAVAQREAPGAGKSKPAARRRQGGSDG